MSREGTSELRREDLNCEGQSGGVCRLQLRRGGSRSEEGSGPSQRKAPETCLDPHRSVVEYRGGMQQVRLQEVVGET